jgi:excisionase family DNA binding protein
MLNTPIPDPLRSKKYVADRLDVHVATVDRAIASGRLKAVRVSARRIGIRESEIERYLRVNEIPAPAEAA